MSEPLWLAVAPLTQPPVNQIAATAAHGLFQCVCRLFCWPRRLTTCSALCECEKDTDGKLVLIVTVFLKAYFVFIIVTDRQVRARVRALLGRCWACSVGSL